MSTAESYTQQGPDDMNQIRESVKSLCNDFPGDYWREKDKDNSYPTEFVEALTKSGFISCLIPEEYGGSGLKITHAGAILEQIHRCGCNGAAVHAQMYIMGTVLRHGSEEQKKKMASKNSIGRFKTSSLWCY